MVIRFGAVRTLCVCVCVVRDIEPLTNNDDTDSFNDSDDALLPPYLSTIAKC